MQSSKAKARKPSFADFVKEYHATLKDSIKQLAEGDSIDIDEEEEEIAEKRLEALMDKDEWTEDHMIELSALLFCLAFAATVSDDDEEEDGEGEDDDD